MGYKEKLQGGSGIVSTSVDGEVQASSLKPDTGVKT